MAKRIDRARIDAGRVELPKKLAFLIDDKVDFSSIVDNDGAYSVELPAASLKKLVAARAQLKDLKTQQKKAAGDRTAALDAETTAHGTARDALTKAERKIKALEKKLAATATASAAPAAGPSTSPPPPDVSAGAASSIEAPAADAPERGSIEAA